MYIFPIGDVFLIDIIKLITIKIKLTLKINLNLADLLIKMMCVTLWINEHYGYSEAIFCEKKHFFTLIFK